MSNHLSRRDSLALCLGLFYLHAWKRFAIFFSPTVLFWFWCQDCTVPPPAILWKSLWWNTGLACAFSLGMNLLLMPWEPGVLFVDRFLPTDLISSMRTKMFRFPVSFWVWMKSNFLKIFVPLWAEFSILLPLNYSQYLSDLVNFSIVPPPFFS